MIALRSLAHSHKQHPPLCVFYTHSLPNKNTPLISSTTSRLEVPSRDFHKTQLPDSIGLSVTRVLTPIGYIALQFDSGGGAQLSPSRRVCPLSHVKRERGRARSRRSPPRFVWLSLIQLRGPDSLKDISSYREASIKLSDPLSLIVTDLKASVKRPHHSTRRSPQSRRSPRSRRSHDRSGTPNRPKKARGSAALTAQTRSPIEGQEGRARLSLSPRRPRARAHAPPSSSRGLAPTQGPAIVTGPPPHLERGPSLAPIAVSTAPWARARAARCLRRARRLTSAMRA